MAGLENRAANETLTGWKIVLGTVEVKEALGKSGEVLSKGHAADSNQNVAAFFCKARMQDVTAKTITTRMRPGYFDACCE